MGLATGERACTEGCPGSPLWTSNTSRTRRTSRTCRASRTCRTSRTSRASRTSAKELFDEQPTLAANGQLRSLRIERDFTVTVPNPPRPRAALPAHSGSCS
jgi:hypothetical protein